MNLAQIKRKGNYQIKNIHHCDQTKRMMSIGFVSNASVYVSGIVVDRHAVVIIDDHLIAIPEHLCKEVMV